MKNVVSKVTDILNNKYLSLVMKRYKDDKLSLYSTQAAFYLIISAVPFLMFLLSLMIYILPINHIQFLNLINDAVPNSLQFWTNSILSVIYSESTFSVTSISAIVSLWAASKSVYALSQGLEEIYNTNNHINSIKSRALSIAYTLGFVMILILTTAVVIFSKPLILLIDSFVPETIKPGIQWIVNILNMSDFIPLLLICLLFCLMYKYLSFSKVKFKDHLPGAFLASFGWLIFSWIYAIYINNYSKISITYGSLANIVIMMLWLKICMNIFLFGAEINVYLKDSRN